MRIVFYLVVCLIIIIFFFFEFCDKVEGNFFFYFWVGNKYKSGIWDGIIRIFFVISNVYFCFF